MNFSGSASITVPDPTHPQQLQLESSFRMSSALAPSRPPAPTIRVPLDPLMPWDPFNAGEAKDSWALKKYGAKITVC